MAASISPSMLDQFTTFGELLRFLRRRAGITQMELSIAVGYSDAQISRLEQNLRVPDIPTIQARFIEPLHLEDEPEALARLVALAAQVKREDTPATGECPYKGLNFFDASDSDLFVGREELTGQLVDRVLSDCANPSTKDRFFVVVGASGSGKSSLVRAGVVPALQYNPVSRDWPVKILTPGPHPLESLALALVENDGLPGTVARMSDEMLRDRFSLSRSIERKLKAADHGFQVLVIDQFEELFALCRYEEERGAFIANLMAASNSEGGEALVLVTLRADFYAACAEYPELREALSRNQTYIGAMSMEELRRVIEEPAARGHWELDDGLVDLILHDVGQEPGALPLLSHALFETWQRRQGRQLTFNGYNVSGGVRGAIAETAEAVLTDKFSPLQQSIARRIFLRLTELGDENASVTTWGVAPGGNRGDTRRRATRDELILKPEDSSETQVVLRAMADARLIVTDENSVQVAHEALIREWPRLRDWLEENRAGLRLHRNLTEAAVEWSTSGRDPGILYRGARLAQAREWAAQHAEDMNQLEQEFLGASVLLSEKEAEERELQHQRELLAAQKLAETERQRAEEQNQAASRLRRRAIYLSLSLAAAFLLILAASFLAWQAKQQSALATARELASASINNLEIDPERSMLLAMQALKIKDIPEAQNALHRAVLASRLRETLSTYESPIYGIAFDTSRDSYRRFAAASEDGTIKVWELDESGLKISTEPLLTLSNPVDFPASTSASSSALAFSPDGDWLAAAGENHTVKIWEAASGELIHILYGHTGNVRSVTFNPDGQLIATTSSDGTVKIWDALTGLELQTLTSRFGYTLAVFSSDGLHLATSDPVGVVELWDRSQAPGEPPITAYFSMSTFINTRIGVVTALAFSPNGGQIAVGSASIQVYDISTIYGPDLLLRFPAHENSITGLHYTPNGGNIMSAGLDGRAVIWDAVTGQEMFTLPGNAGPIIGFDINRSGDSAVIAYLSTNLIKLWDLTDTGNREWFRMGGFNNDNVRFFIKKDHFLITQNAGSSGPVIQVSDVSGDDVKVVSSIELHSDQPGLNFDVDQEMKRLVMIYSNEYIVHVWDLATGQEVKSFSVEKTGSQPGITIKGFIATRLSPDGSRLATGAYDGTLIIWDVYTGKPVQELVGHTGRFESIDPLDFSPDGTLLASASFDGTVCIWDVGKGTLLYQLPGQTDIYPSVSFSPDGALLMATVDGRLVNVWDVKTGKLLRTLQGSPTLIYNLAFSPDNRYMSAAYLDGNTYIWDAETGAELLRLPGYFTRFSTDSQHLVTLYQGGFYGYFLSIDDLLSLASSRLTRTWTPEECSQFLHMDRCPQVP